MKKILLIEDDADQALLYRVPFELEGFEIMTEAGGRDGFAKAVGWQPDIILLDIIMDEMDGMEVLRQLKGNEHTKNIPVVMLTNVFKKEIVNEAKALGAVDFWEKTKVMPKDVVQKSKIILKI